MHGEITKYLVSCLDADGVVDLDKFFSRYPESSQISSDLVKLMHLGYISLDYGDNRITGIAATKKLLDLREAL